MLSDGRIVTGSWDETVKVCQWKQFDNRDRYKPVVKLGYKTFPSGTRLFTLITSETFDRTRDLAFFGKHLGLNVRATLHNTSESGLCVVTCLQHHRTTAHAHSTQTLETGNFWSSLCITS